MGPCDDDARPDHAQRRQQYGQVDPRFPPARFDRMVARHEQQQKRQQQGKEKSTDSQVSKQLSLLLQKTLIWMLTTFGMLIGSRMLVSVLVDCMIGGE